MRVRPLPHSGYWSASFSEAGRLPPAVYTASGDLPSVVALGPNSSFALSAAQRCRDPVCAAYASPYAGLRFPNATATGMFTLTFAAFGARIAGLCDCSLDGHAHVLVPVCVFCCCCVFARFPHWSVVTRAVWRLESIRCVCVCVQTRTWCRTLG